MAVAAAEVVDVDDVAGVVLVSAAVDIDVDVTVDRKRPAEPDWDGAVPDTEAAVVIVVVLK